MKTCRTSVQRTDSYRKVSLELLLFFSGLAVTSAAHAARPLVTEDAGILDSGQCEIEMYFERSRVSDEPQYYGGTLQPGCGVGFRTQLSASAARSGGAPSTRQVGFVGKTAIVPLSESSPGLTIGYSFEWSKASGESLRSDGGLLIAVVTLPLAQKWLAHANAGWQRIQEPRDNPFFWALAIERESVGGTRLDLMAETYRDSGRSPWVAIGARYNVIEERLSINASIAARGRSETETLFTLGARIGF